MKVRPDPQEMMTVDTVAAELLVSPKTVRRWIDGGDLPVYRFGRQIRVSGPDFRAFMALRRK